METNWECYMKYDKGDIKPYKCSFCEKPMVVGENLFQIMVNEYEGYQNSCKKCYDKFKEEE